MKKQTNVFYNGRYINADHYLQMEKSDAIMRMVKDGVVKDTAGANEAYPLLQKQHKEDTEAHNKLMQKKAEEQRLAKQQRSGNTAMPSTLQGVAPETPGKDNDSK